ncbi:4766_t:CDS:2, partial [Funneliformis geosporum]
MENNTNTQVNNQKQEDAITVEVEELRNEYDQYLKNCEDSSEEIIGDLKINEEVAKQIRNLENAYCSKVSAFRDKHLHSYYCLPQEK